ncbi:hypothetical protein Q75_10915 [Bacillus coahuilensis p1.1.43]|uniref:GGDEF domain-containing protein n=3 Tax=Bacillus coahuilensis TaxID=408580 RepID=A0A147K7D4_9BACI|nr:hypothetical protein Q75_10915 [Bacillus coahuilensis p1.1.43]
MFGYILLVFLVSYFPIVINQTPIVNIQWVTIAAFLQFGLYFEILLTQMAVLFMLVRLNLGKGDSYRFPMNSLMFFFISLCSGLVYFAVGGNTSDMQFSSLIGPIIIYQISLFLFNELFLVVAQWYTGRKRKLFGEDVVWDIIGSLVSLPLGLSLYYLIQEIGSGAFLLLGVPFVCVSYLLTMYKSSEDVNKILQKAADIGHDLTERLRVEEVLSTFITRIVETIPGAEAYIYDVKQGEFLLLEFSSDATRLPRAIQHENSWEIFKQVSESKSPMLVKNNEIKDHELKKENWKNLMVVPIIRSQKVEGILLLTTYKRSGFKKYEVMIADILASYLGVAIQNARNYEKTKRNSERCGLTGLYNFRFFENFIELEMALLKDGKRQNLSLILLDIDHFKQINDTYGHQAGNEILIDLSRRLQNFIGKKGTVARFGGEEFVVLLPDFEKNEAVELAEQFRLSLESEPFPVHDTMVAPLNDRVYITASFGVSSAFLDSDDETALVRNADRALYVGAKQKGRNKVASYSRG